MRVGCGSATIGIFARQWAGKVDEVVVVDDHITGVLTEHQAGSCLDLRPSGIRLRGRKSTPGATSRSPTPVPAGAARHHRSARDRRGLGPEGRTAGMRLLMVSTTGEDAAWYVLDEVLVPAGADAAEVAAQVVDRIGENCEPALATVLFVGGAGGSLRAGVTENPILLTRSIKDLLVRVTCGGAPAYIWPGGGITVMVDVARMPERSFGTVPTPAIVAPIEFTCVATLSALGGHVDRIRPLAEVLALQNVHRIDAQPMNPWPVDGLTGQGAAAR